MCVCVLCVCVCVLCVCVRVCACVCCVCVRVCVVSVKSDTHNGYVGLNKGSLPLGRQHASILGEKDGSHTIKTFLVTTRSDPDCFP